MDLFDQEEAPTRTSVVPLEDRLEFSIEAIARLYRQGDTVAAAFSGGKDSYVLTSVAFMAALRVKAEGLSPGLLVLHADTGIENPVIWATARAELEAMSNYARNNDIRCNVAIASPQLGDTWAVRTLSGRAMPSTPERRGDCTIDWKIKPMERLRAKVLPDWGRGKRVVTLTGTRFDESARRASKMAKRGESDCEPQRNSDKEWVMAPIAMWSTDDVWEFIGLVGAGVYESYSDGSRVRDAYADAGPTSCSVVNDAIFDGAPKQGGCGARFGCYLCMQVKSDRSMTALLDKPEYGFMRKVSAFRQWMLDTDYDMAERHWVGRTIRNGYVAVRPDGYSPNKLRQMFRLAVSIDAEEIEAARAAGLRRPRFQMVSLEQMFAIDALWSLYGHWDGFAALDDYWRIHFEGERYEVPEVKEPFPLVPMSEPRFLEVGEDWNDASGRHFAGFVTPETFGLIEPCLARISVGTRKQVDAWQGMVGDHDGMQVDAESAAMFLEFEAEQYRVEGRKHRGAGFANTYRTYLRYGLLSLSARMVHSHNDALHRNHYKRVRGLNGPALDMDWLMRESVGLDEVPAEVRDAFLNRAQVIKWETRREDAIAETRQIDLFAA